MGWADGHIARLMRGDTVQFRPRGNSMVGKISSGQLCTVEPLGDRMLAVGDIVLHEGLSFEGGVVAVSDLRERRS